LVLADSAAPLRCAFTGCIAFFLRQIIFISSLNSDLGGLLVTKPSSFHGDSSGWFEDAVVCSVLCFCFLESGGIIKYSFLHPLYTLTSTL
jgi:hypothetical protein